jgi:outer membrane protein TolC
MIPPSFRDPHRRFAPTFLTRPALALTMAALVGGCAVGPEFRSPTLSGEAGYRRDALPESTVSAPVPTGDAQRFLEGEAVSGAWWTRFASDELTRRVDLALANSPSIASAQAALRQAQAETSVARGGLFPTIDATVGANRQ